MPSVARLALPSLACVVSLACSPAGSTRDPESLGYGPATGRDLANGYVDGEGPPFERRAPAAWPLDQQPLASWSGPAPVLAAPPILASEDTRQLCVHVVEFLLADSSELDVGLLADTCHLYARTEKLARTAERWQQFSTCMLAAETEAAFDGCEETYPSSLDEPGELTDHPREREVCQHLVMTTLYEQVGSDANLPASELERFRPIIGDCVDGLIADDQTERSPEDYAAMLDCVLEQSTSAAMEACE